MNKLTVAASAICTSILFSSPGLAQNVDAKLDKAMGLIDKQSKQIERLSRELSTLKRKGGGGGSSSAELEERLYEIEELAFDLDEKIGSRGIVKVFDADSLDIGGFLHTMYSHAKGDDSTISAFNIQNFELLVKANIDENWSAFIAAGYLREGFINFDATATNPTLTISNLNPLIIGWTNYKHNDLFNIKIGRMITPHGIVNIEHFPQILLDPTNPQFLRPFSGDTIFPNFTTGVQAHGKYFFKSGDSIQYNTYASGVQSNPNDKSYGGRIAANHSDLGVTVGLNIGTSSGRNSTIDSEYSFYGADLLINKGPILWKSEIFQTDETQAGVDDRFAWYTQPAWRITDKWTTFYRYDYLDDGDDSDGGATVENVVGLTFKPKPYVHIRALTKFIDFEQGGTVTEDRDAVIYEFTTTVSF